MKVFLVVFLAVAVFIGLASSFVSTNGFSGAKDPAISRFERMSEADKNSAQAADHRARFIVDSSFLDTYHTASVKDKIELVADSNFDPR